MAARSTGVEKYGVVAESPVVVSAMAVDMRGMPTGALLSARLWQEEPPATAGGGVNTSYSCMHVIVVNPAAAPIIARITIAGLSSTAIVTIQRKFGTVYSLNLTRIADADGFPQHDLLDQLDGWSANVYQIGCETIPSANRVVNGNFELVEPTKPTQFRLDGGAANAWHVYAGECPKNRTDVLRAQSDGLQNTLPSCTLSSFNYTDDRAKVRTAT
jgi:hypothetical protein